MTDLDCLSSLFLGWHGLRVHSGCGVMVVGWVRHGGVGGVGGGGFEFGSLVCGFECFAGSFATGLVSFFVRFLVLLFSRVVVWREAEQLGRGFVWMRGSVSLAHVFA